MKNINRTYKKIPKKEKIFSSFFQTKIPKIKFNDITNSNAKLTDKSNNYFIKKEREISKHGILTIRNRPKNKRGSILSNTKTEKEFSSQYPLNSKKSAIILALKQINNEKNLINCKSCTQDNFSRVGLKKIPNVKLNFFRNLIENINKNENFKNIDYIIESPYRGVERIQKCSNKNKDQFYKSVYNKKCFYKKMKNDSIKSYSDIHSLSQRKNKEIDNPIGKISKISGISCYKLRKALDYSLSHNLKDLLNNRKNKNEEEKKNIQKINKMKCFFRNNRHKKFHWMISLKPKQNYKFENCVNENSIEFHDDADLENIISSKKGISTRNH